jgi:DNA-binding transcriptional MocR family regulator
MATPLVAEIATKWVADGTAMQLVQWQRAAIARRHVIADALLQGTGAQGHASSLHLWLTLPAGWSEESFVAQARLRGVAVAPGLSFRISDAPWQPAVRISLGSTTEAELEHGLGTVATLLRGDPEHLLLAI